MSYELADIVARLERLEAIFVRYEKGTRYKGKPQREVVRDVLTEAGEPLSSLDIGIRAGISAGSIRMALYSNPTWFSRSYVSPGRVRWSLAAASAPAGEGGGKR